MSSSLVKKSLSLFEDDLREEPVKKKKAKSKDPMLAISTKKKGVKKEIQNLRKQQHKKTESKKLHASLYRDSRTDAGSNDHTDKSVEMLSRISQLDSANRVSTSKSAQHQQKKKKKQKTAKPTDNTDTEEKSAFSEKDFEDFAKEFDFSKLKNS